MLILVVFQIWRVWVKIRSAFFSRADLTICETPYCFFMCLRKNFNVYFFALLFLVRANVHITDLKDERVVQVGRRTFCEHMLANGNHCMPHTYIVRTYIQHRTIE